MKRISSWNLIWLPILALFFGLSLQAQSQDIPETGIGGAVDMSIYSDNIAMRLVLETEVWRKETYVVIDYAQINAFEIQSCVLGTLRFGEGEDTLKIRGPNLELSVNRSDIGVAADLLCNTLTAEYAEENDQIDVAAKIGWPILKHYALNLDFDSQRLTLTPSAEKTEAEARRQFELVIQGLQQINDEVWVPVVANETDRVFMQFDTSTYHTRIDRTFGDTLAYPGEDAAEIAFVDGDKSKSIKDMAALMQTPTPEEDQGLFVMASGLSLLTGFNLEINPNAGYLALTQVKNSNWREEDTVFYQAMRNQDRHELDAFLELYPEDRNVEEAVLNRFVLGLDAADSLEPQMAALEKGLNVTPEQEKFRYLNDFLNVAFSSDAQPDLSITVGVRALDFVALAENPGDRQKVQLLLGDLHYGKEEVEDAWRYYLASAFNGDPRLEGVVKVKLATVYEEQQRWRRAYANYARSLRDQRSLPEDLAADAQEGLSRIRDHLDPSDPLIEEAQNILEYVAKPVKLGEPLSIVKASNLDGVEQSLTDFQGKVVLIDVWATWCGPCIAGIPKLREVAQQFEGTDFTVLSVSADDQVETVKEFLIDEPLPWDHWHIGASSDVHLEWNIRGYPTYMLIDQEGTLLARGYSLTDEMIDLIEQNVKGVSVSNLQ